MRKFFLVLGWLITLTLFPSADSFSQTPKCATGRTYNDSQKACVYNMAAFCPEGFGLQGERCVRGVTCPAGSVNDGAGCTVPCPNGYTIKNFGRVVCAGPPPCPSTARVVSYEENRRIAGREPNATVESGECRMECPGWWPVQWLDRRECKGPGDCPLNSSFDKTSGVCVASMRVGCSGRRSGDMCFETPSCERGFQFKNGRCVRG